MRKAKVAESQEMVIEDISAANKEYGHYGRKQSANLMNHTCTAVFFVMICCLRLQTTRKPSKIAWKRK
jgi:hypothetical protein